MPPATASPSLLGVDVGYSRTARSTGLAWRVGGRIGACRTGSGWTARAAALPPGTSFDLAALDAPLVPTGPGTPRRSCEAVFCRGAFTRRCRPGMTHFGQGLAFREAGALAADQFSSVVGSEHRLPCAAIAGAAMVEAFPNAFMGVLLPDAVLARLPPGRSGRSDRLYEACLAEGIFERVIGLLDWPVAETIAQIAGERDHDIRAAYVCLLTAGLAFSGMASVVGDEVGGWLWLPPLDLWAHWARASVAVTLEDARMRGYLDVLMQAADVLVPG